jgi:rhodanese-related sulfurtransferase
LAFQMNQKQIANTYALKGGTAAWLAAGYPTEK